MNDSINKHEKGVERTIRLDLLPLFLRIHKLEPVQYDEEKNLLIVKKTEAKAITTRKEAK